VLAASLQQALKLPAGGGLGGICSSLTLLGLLAASLKRVQSGWQSALQKGQAADVSGLIRWYAVYELILSKSADVKSAFPLQTHTLGVVRLRSRLCSLDCRLQVK
jgi:hypothetical protein